METIKKQRLYETHKGLIFSIAKRFTGRGVSLEELFQIGCVGFLKAADGFDDSFGTKFSTYAVPYIAGELKRYFRDGGQVKVSRSVKSLYVKICAAREEFINRWGREPLISELAAGVDSDTESVSYALLSMTPVASIYNKDGEIDQAVLKIEDNNAEEVCERLSLNEAVNELPPLYRSVIRKRYFDNMTQSSIAGELSTSQVQISRLEKKALGMLRSKLEGG